MGIFKKQKMTAEEYIREKWGEEWLTHDWQAGDVVTALEEYAALQSETSVDSENE